MKFLKVMNEEMQYRFDVLYPIENGYSENGKLICSKWRARRRLVADWFRECFLRGLSEYSLWSKKEW